MRAERPSQAADLEFFVAPRLDDAQLRSWREFADLVPWSHYRQDPAWAEVERARAAGGVRKPSYFWAEREGVVCLTALGIRHRLPVRQRVFWEFNQGPTVLDPEVLDAWLLWLASTRRREVALIRVQPALALDHGGDEAETILEQRGFVRRRTSGVWSTLVVDIDRDEDEILASFRQQTRYEIRQSSRVGVEVSQEDTPQGWSTLVSLNEEVAQRAPVRRIETGEIAAISRHWLAGGLGGTVLVARHDGEALAAALVVRHGPKAFAPLLPTVRRGKLSASHLLVWEAMRWAKSQGCVTYDVVGYSLTARAGDPLRGVNQFKRGFARADQVTKTVALHERVFSPVTVAIRARVQRLRSRRSAMAQSAGQ